MNPTTITPRRARRASLVLAAAISSCVIAACGSGATTTSITSSSSKAASASAKTGSSKARSTFVACLEQHGVTPAPGGRRRAWLGQRHPHRPAAGRELR